MWALDNSIKMENNEEKSIIEKAINFAVKAHQGQKRKGSGLPYIVHPLAVANYVRFYIVEPIGKLSVEELIVCGYLHDTIEDTNVTYEDINKEFGEKVANVVKELTNDDNQIAKIGKERYITTKLLTMSVDALAVKLCDRLDNLFDSAGPYFDSQKKEQILKTNENIFKEFEKRNHIPKCLIVIKKQILNVLSKY